VQRPARFRRTWKRRVPRNLPLPDGELDLGPIVSPLRYDIMVRADFFHFLDSNADIFRADPSEFLYRARQHPYFVWFTELALPREIRQPVTEEAVMVAFKRRLQKTYELYWAVRNNGFDPNHPVIMRRPKTVLPTATGKEIRRDLFVTDGCHRLALMEFAGMRSVPAAFYRVAVTKEPFTPLDNTVPLVRALRPAPDAYARFLSHGYGSRPMDDLVSLRDDVAQHHPESLAEFDSVVTIDSAGLHDRDRR
jgi:hypothetical protein